MLDYEQIKRVDNFGEQLIERLQAIGKSGEWGANFELEKASGSEYYSSKIKDGGNVTRKNWLQINLQTYWHPSYSSPIPWKLQLRFIGDPISPLFVKKVPPYIRDRKPLEWSLSGDDVYAIPYDKLAEVLSVHDEGEILNEILDVLRVSYCHYNGQPLPQESVNNPNSIEQGDGGDKPPSQDSTGDWPPPDRKDVTISIDEAIWSELREIVAQQYRPRKKQSKRPSYAKLLNDAIDSALLSYISQWKNLGESEDHASEK